MPEPGSRSVGRAPVSTYRLQVTADFDLYAAADRLAHLHELGVDWVYLSPLLEAEPGSGHGYDVIRHDRVDPSRGGAEGLATLAREARRLGLGVLVDIVPNHVGVATPPLSVWWWELLRDGPGSTAAERFDVDWAAGGDRIRIPVVGDDDLASDGTVGSLSLGEGPDGHELRYHDHRFPVAPGTGQGTAEEVHDRQHYELVGWRRADHELNYRRFFAINTLAAVRVEEQSVFDGSHAEIRRWFDEGLVDGLRVDHPDGLRDPAGYLDDLAALTGGAYVLVEKILEPGEELEPTWATEGTTGYDALAFVDRVLVDPAGRQPLEDLEARLRGAPVDWHQLIHDTKRDVADTILGSEVRRIVREVVAGSQDDQLVDAVAELLACFPVYRSYLPQGGEHLDEAFRLARRHRPDLEAAYALLEPVLHDPKDDAAKRFQQTSGMVMAKGVEDCAFYRYSRLTSLNEVGGDPSVFAVTPDDFHTWAAKRQREWPRAMTALTTHDTKRSEDVRTRISVLAEVPDVWASALDRLLTLVPLPDPGFADLLWQAVVGTWPASRERLHAYAEKAMREAGDRTRWTAPDEDYERQVHAAVDAAYDDPEVTAVLTEVLDRIVAAGWSNSLAAKLLALTMPGVPDVYQGSELWEQSLVDPDNRRPVDAAAIEAAARSLESGPPVLTGALDDPGAAKLAVVRAALRARRDRSELFGSYEPLAAEGPAADHVLAFDRGGAVTVVTRLPLGLAENGGWGETVLALPEGRWVDVLSAGFPGDEPGPAPHTPRGVGEEADSVQHLGNRIRLADLLADLPVALLVREDS